MRRRSREREELRALNYNLGFTSKPNYIFIQQSSLACIREIFFFLENKDFLFLFLFLGKEGNPNSTRT